MKHLIFVHTSLGDDRDSQIVPRGVVDWTTRWRLVARHGVFLLALGVAAVLLSWNLTKPLDGYEDGNGGFFGVMARNYLRYGYAATKLGPVTNPGLARPEEFRYYPDHPVMLPILVSLSYRIFGVTEASARLVSIIFTLAGLVLWYRIVLMHYGRAVAAWAVLFLVISPMIAFFGATLIYHPLSMFFVLLILFWYLRWEETRHGAAFAGMLLSFLIGAMSDWSVYFMVPFLVLHCWFTPGSSTSQRWQILSLPLMAVGTFLLFLAHLWTIGGTERLAELFDALFYRSGANLPQGFVPRTILNLGYALYLFTPIALLLASAWAIRIVRRIASRETLGSDGLLSVLLGFGLVIPIVFGGGGAVHPFYLFDLGPFVALAAALSINWLYRRVSIRGRGWAIAVTIIVFSGFVTEAMAHIWYLKTFSRAEDRVLRPLGLWLREHSSPDARMLVLMNPRYQNHALEYYAERELLIAGRAELNSISRTDVEKQVRQTEPGHGFRYVIVPDAVVNGGATTTLLPCRWPRLDGFACFEVPSNLEEWRVGLGILVTSMPPVGGDPPGGPFGLLATKIKILMTR
jgi:hypothetical protein